MATKIWILFLDVCIYIHIYACYHPLCECTCSRAFTAYERVLLDRQLGGFARGPVVVLVPHHHFVLLRWGLASSHRRGQLLLLLWRSGDWARALPSLPAVDLALRFCCGVLLG